MLRLGTRAFSPYAHAQEHLRSSQMADFTTSRKKENMNVNIAIATLLLIVLLGLSACSDAERTQLMAVGSSGHITCYSGTLKIYEGDATGKIATESHSDGWFFKEKVTGDLIRVSGSCLIRN